MGGGVNQCASAPPFFATLSVGDNSMWALISQRVLILRNVSSITYVLRDDVSSDQESSQYQLC